jgi:anti-anti-sigma regulatory factor
MLTKRAEMAGGALVLRSVSDEVLRTFDAIGVRSSLHIDRVQAHRSHS